MKWVVAGLVVSFFSFTAQAKPAAKKKPSATLTSYSPKSTSTSTTTEKRDTYRPEDDRSGSVGVAATAGVLYFGAGYGVDLWYMASKKLQLGIEINQAKTEIDSRDQGGDTAFLNEYLNIDLTGFKAQGRLFVWNSLFVSSGVSYNLVKGEYGFAFGETDDHTGRKYEATMLMAHVGLGNQWKLKNGLILGGEWVGAAAHLSTSVKDGGDASVYSSASGTSASETEFDEAEFRTKVKSKLEGQMQLTLAMLTLGYEF